MIYLDMDGVIADFFSAVAIASGVNHWKSINDKEIAFRKLMHTDFFFQISPFIEGDVNFSDQIVDLVQEYAKSYELNWGICSSPMRGDEYNSSYWKREWLISHGYMPRVENCVFTHEKEKYAFSKHDGKPNILIDDKPENVFKFRKAGGIAIRFQANEDDLEYLQTELDYAISIRGEL